MRGKTRGLLGMMFGVALALVAALGVAPREALADGTTYDPASKYTRYDASSDDTVKIDGVEYNDAVVEWYVIGYDSGAKTVTLLSKQALGEHEFDSIDSNTNIYASSSIKKYVEGLTDAGQPLAGIAGALADVSDATGEPSLSGYGAVPYLLSTGEANDDTSMSVTKRKGADNGGMDWWLRSPGNSEAKAAYVRGDIGIVKDSGNNVYLKEGLGVRPALKLDLESVIFESESKIFSLPGKVTGVKLNPSTATLTEGGDPVALKATVNPEDATDQTVMWSVGGTDSSAVTLYSDEACKTEVGTDATETLTVYAKGVSAGEATVTCTSNADKTKSASCEVTVSAAKHAVTVAASPAEGGTAEASPAEAAEGEKVTLTATATDGYEFVNWTLEGDGAKLDNADSATTKLTMGAADVTATANFRKKAEPTPEVVPDASVAAHVQRIGWMDPVTDGTAAGTTGRSRRMEALTLKLPDGVAGGIEYRGHVQRSGWEKTWASDGNVAGTTGKSRRVEAVQIQLTGEAKDAYDVYYLVAKDAPAPDATYKGVTQQYAKAFVKK